MFFPSITSTASLSTKENICSSNDVGTTATFAEQDEYEYFRGSCPKAYHRILGPGNSRPAEVQQAERTLVYLRKLDGSTTDWMVILDRTQAGSGAIHPHVVFQSVFEPAIGNGWNTSAPGQVVHPGQWKYENSADMVVTNTHPYDLYGGAGPVANAHARAFFRVLYPQDVDIHKIGGGEHSMDGFFGEAPDTGYLDKFLNASQNSQVLLGGYWRAHVVPKNQSATQTVFPLAGGRSWSSRCSPGTT